MKIFKKKEINSINGITLIALVITIIVLLILAGISISMLSGDNGILQKATDAKQTSERAEAKELAKIDIMAWITDKTANHQDASLDDEKVKEILSDNKSYVKEAKETSFITSKGEYEIPYSELYETGNSELTLGYDALKQRLQATDGNNGHIDINANVTTEKLWNITILNDEECKLSSPTTRMWSISTCLFRKCK